jgi:hypothetical protein
MSKLKLSIATTDYDHFRDFRLGTVKAGGIDHTWLELGHHENRATWEQMALYTHQQGIAHRGFTPEEIFPPGVASKIVI